VHFDVVGDSVQGEPIVFITAFIVLVLLAFARPWAESLVMLVVLGGVAVAAILTGRRVANVKIEESEKASAGGVITTDGKTNPSPYLVGVPGLLTPPLLGLAGAYLVLAGKAWSLLLVAAVLLFAAYLKAKDLFTIVVVLLVGAGIVWLVVAGSSRMQAGFAVGLVWLLLIGGATLLVSLTSGGSVKGGPEKPATLIPGFLGLAFIWFVTIIAIWLGTRRLLGI
jgi:Peptidase M50B-like